MPILLFIFALSSPVWAQSGGRSKQNPPFDPQSQNRPGSVTKQLSSQSAPTFFVVTSYHDDPQLFALEDFVRGACHSKLKSVPGVKIIENDDVSRWEAKELAFSADDQTWVIWIELKFRNVQITDPGFLKVQYLLYEPGSGKILSGGLVSTSAGSWQSRPPGSWPGYHVDLRELARYAGHEIAEQVMGELGFR
ncbi:MAG TPA: hypothetical protein PL157_08195 [Acidobacteriota bacterium]|nr:hypothetical protein [Acidobacteriota bacterium]